MRIAIVDAGKSGASKAAALAASMAKTLVAAGHFADIIATGGNSQTPRLSFYDFIIVCSEPEGLWGRLGREAGDMLSAAGSIGGKRSMAVMKKSGFMSGKALKRLMSAMEGEGMLVTSGDIARDAREASVLAADAPLERK